LDQSKKNEGEKGLDTSEGQQDPNKINSEMMVEQQANNGQSNKATVNDNENSDVINNTNTQNNTNNTNNSYNNQNILTTKDTIKRNNTKKSG